MTQSEIANKIRENLELSGSNYFSITNNNGVVVKIRTSNHSCNKMNNSDSEITLSFISKRTEQRKSGYNQIAGEYAILENGLTDTFQEIEEILEWNDIY